MKMIILFFHLNFLIMEVYFLFSKNKNTKLNLKEN